MIVEVKAEIEKMQKFESDNYTGKGSCTTFEQMTIKGQWELPNGHPNLDCYEYLENDVTDMLMSNIGFTPNYKYEVLDIDVSIWGNSQEWLEQAKTLHDGLYSDNPKEGLEIMAKMQNFELASSEIESILNSK